MDEGAPLRIKHRRIFMEFLYRPAQVANVREIRWQRANIVVADGPDPRMSHLLFQSAVVNCWPASGFVRFANGKVYVRGSRTIDGLPVYFFLFSDVWELWKRRTIEYALWQYLAEAPACDASTVAELLTEASGNPGHLDPLGSREDLLELVRRRLIHVGSKDLESLLDLLCLAPVGWGLERRIQNCA
jgi:hypothetical protein